MFSEKTTSSESGVPGSEITETLSRDSVATPHESIADEAKDTFELDPHEQALINFNKKKSPKSFEEVKASIAVHNEKEKHHLKRDVVAKAVKASVTRYKNIDVDVSTPESFSVPDIDILDIAHKTLEEAYHARRRRFVFVPNPKTTAAMSENEGVAKKWLRKIYKMK